MALDHKEQPSKALEEPLARTGRTMYRVSTTDVIGEYRSRHAANENAVGAALRETFAALPKPRTVWIEAREWECPDILVEDLAAHLLDGSVFRGPWRRLVLVTPGKTTTWRRGTSPFDAEIILATVFPTRPS